MAIQELPPVSSEAHGTRHHHLVIGSLPHPQRRHERIHHLHHIAECCDGTILKVCRFYRTVVDVEGEGWRRQCRSRVAAGIHPLAFCHVTRRALQQWRGRRRYWNDDKRKHSREGDEDIAVSVWRLRNYN
ncbi:hypothetical protein E2C01_020251 [Portunus trituberculatus]|uniref:Uncharacterized protein n=1 Tax=Portunus trituberculatus TaxID=210409 RepID=A0A5B7E2N4_PORTR|nr:hypothetical protein [Portunus trituberculatus]